MFDEPPANLPVEPQSAGPVPKPPIGGSGAFVGQVPPQPKPASGAERMQNGILVGSATEPEDMLADVESADSRMSTNNASDILEEVPRGGKRMKSIILILSGVIGLVLLFAAGYFLYQRFMVEQPAAQPAVTDDAVTDRTLPTPPVQNGGAQVPEEVKSEPVVEPTPQPNIPEPTPVNTAVDTDSDGLSDDQEADFGSDPNVVDTDGDGLNDGEEFDLGTDVLVADSDGDGLSDGNEENVWKTDPLNVDTDGDGFSDGSEVQNGYDPIGPGRLPESEI